MSLTLCVKTGLPKSRHFASKTPFTSLLWQLSLCCGVILLMLPCIAFFDIDICIFFGLLAGVIVLIPDFAEVVSLFQAPPASQL